LLKLPDIVVAAEALIAQEDITCLEALPLLAQQGKLLVLEVSDPIAQQATGLETKAGA